MPFPRDVDKPLRDDVRLLGELLGHVIKAREGEDVFETVELVRRLAKSARAGRDEDFLTLRERVLTPLSTASALPVARAFAHFLNLANIAEQHHRIRRRREYLRDPVAGPQPGSLEETIPRLLSSGVAPERLGEAIRALRIELVLTAHPTEVARRTVLQKHNRIAALLGEQDRPDLTRAEHEEVAAALRREIQALWETDEVRRDRPSPLDEVRWGLAIFEQTLWDGLPRYLRALDRVVRERVGGGLAPEAVPVRFGTWMGGDRDGNPNVTAAITWRACLMARWVAAGLYLREVDGLRGELSMAGGSAELQARCPGEREPYRALLRGVSRRLRATRDWMEELLATEAESVHELPAVDQPAARPDVWLSPEGLSDALSLCHRSLMDTGNAVIAEGRLLDLLRRVWAFGMVLAPLDLRQDAGVHDETMDAVALASGGSGRWTDWDEAERCRFLAPYLAAAASPLSLAVDTGERDVRDTIETFHAAARIPRGSLGAYVVTMASRPSDVLAVLALQRAAGVTAPLRVVPLFETARDLERAGSVLRDLFAIDAYRRHLDGRQEIMVGYSDSTKDVGRFTAGWALYKAQEAIVEACRDAGVEPTIFHGRGGSVGRGGGPTHLAIRSLPAGAVNGSLRVTEQGEMIQAHFGLPDLAVRTLEVYTTATLEATLTPALPPRDDWRTRMEALAVVARDAYRRLVYDHPRFVEYFRAATPEAELGRLNIGSRPARRSPGGGVESLRAIPWQFAWTQTRLLLASWLGLEEALEPAAASWRERAALNEMYREWPYFQVLIDLQEMVLAKADARIAREYDRSLVPADLQGLGEQLRQRLVRAMDGVLAASGHVELLAGNPVLKRSIAVRNPYVDPINLLQVELLARLRAKAAEDDDLPWTAFVVTVNGIAAGMRNAG